MGPLKSPSLSSSYSHGFSSIVWLIGSLPLPHRCGFTNVPPKRPALILHLDWAMCRRKEMAACNLDVAVFWNEWACWFAGHFEEKFQCFVQLCGWLSMAVGGCGWLWMKVEMKVSKKCCVMLNATFYLDLSWRQAHGSRKASKINLGDAVERRLESQTTRFSGVPFLPNFLVVFIMNCLAKLVSREENMY